MQTRTQSMIEAITNTAVGYGINVTANFVLFPLFGWQISLEQNLALGVFYTAISIARGFCLRRLYNHIHGRQFLARIAREQLKTAEGDE